MCIILRKKCVIKSKGRHSERGSVISDCLCSDLLYSDITDIPSVDSEHSAVLADMEGV